MDEMNIVKWVPQWALCHCGSGERKNECGCGAKYEFVDQSHLSGEITGMFRQINPPNKQNQADASS